MKILLLGALALSFAPLCPAFEQSGSLPGDLFVPGNHVPLSPFRSKESLTITLPVNGEVLTWLGNQPGGLSSIKIALEKPSGQVIYLGTTVNTTTNEVSTTNTLIGPCVVVSEQLLQDVDLVSHWEMNAAYPRGHQSPNATDAIAVIDYDPSSGEIVEIPATGITPPGGVFPTDTFALFSDGSGLYDNYSKPAFEVYIGENFTDHTPTPLAAIALSDQVRAATGWPLAHRNPATAAATLLEDAPLLQIVHANIVPYDDPTIPGKEESLATLLLPPHWVRQPDGPGYPILFNGFYDIYVNTFTVNGPDYLGILSNLEGQGRLAMGVIWNCGATRVSGALQSTLQRGAEKVFDLVQSYGGDRHHVVFTGQSKGGTCALELASNPYGLDWSAAYVRALDPQTWLAQSVDDYLSATYKAAQGALIKLTGDPDSWQPGWTNASGESALDVTIKNLYNPPTRAEADANALLSSRYLDGAPSGTLPAGLKNSPLHPAQHAGKPDQNQARIVLLFDTHDHFGSFIQHVEYIEALEAAGFPLWVEIFYRGGHNDNTVAGSTPSDEDLLNMVFNDLSTLDDHRVHRRPPAPGSDDYTDIFDPGSRLPLVVELPIVVTQKDYHAISFVGQPGLRVELTLTDGTTTFTLRPKLDSSGSWGTARLWVPAPSVPAGSKYVEWTYTARYVGDSTFLGAAHASAFPAPTFANNLAVWETPIRGASTGSRCGGLSEDPEF